MHTYTHTHSEGLDGHWGYAYMCVYTYRMTCKKSQVIINKYQISKILTINQK